MKKFFTIIICIFSAYSCEKKLTIKKVETYKTVINSNIGKKLIIPDSLELYQPFPNMIKKEKMSNTNLKIYSHIDASCGTCIETLKAWAILIPELYKKNIKVILICSSDNRFELLKYYFESKEIENFPYPLFLDYKNIFKEKNKFMLVSKNFETILTDNNNKILLIGNPNFSDKIKELYFKEIEKHKNKKP